MCMVPGIWGVSISVHIRLLMYIVVKIEMIRGLQGQRVAGGLQHGGHMDAGQAGIR